MKLLRFFHPAIGAAVFCLSAKFFSSNTFYDFFMQHSSVVACIMSFAVLFLYAAFWHIAKTFNEYRKYRNDGE